MGISPPIEAASLGMADSLILMVLALVVFGPRRLPQIGRQIGKLMYEFRKASNDFKYQMEEELRNAEDADRRKREEAERQRALTEAQNAVAQAQSAAEQAVSAAKAAQNAAENAAQMAQGSPDAAEIGETVSVTEVYAEESVVIEDSVVADPRAAESELRAQPPSTGEQVAARRPGRGSVGWEEAQPAAAIEPVTPSAAPVPSENEEKKEAAVDETPAATETTARHG